MGNKINVGHENDHPIEIFYKDWGEGRPIVFSHGWPLNSDVWDNQMMFLADRGYRVIAHDRRGHGRSSQPWSGNDMNTYADDLGKLIETLDLRDAVLVGHSTGGGEVTRYMARHRNQRVAKLVLLGAVTPLMVRTESNPTGLPITAFDEIRSRVLEDRSQYFKDLSLPFYGYNRWGAKVSQGIRDGFWLYGMQVGMNAVYDCIRAFSETDFTDDLKGIEVPTLIIHGDDDQIVPLKSSAALTEKLVQGSILKVYPGAPHGISQTHQHQFNDDLQAFIEGRPLS